MPEKANNPNNPNNPAADIFDQGLSSYEQALRAGLKLHEEAGKNWIRMCNLAAAVPDFQRQVAAFDNELISTTRKSMDDCVQLLERNTRASVDLMKKGMDAAHTGSFTEAHAKVTDFCENSLKALKANAQAIVEINNQTMDSWLTFAKKATSPIAEAKAQTEAKAQK